MDSQDTKPSASDSEYIDRARAGDSSAFAELWRRHYRPAVRVARQFTSIDADDLVSEAYVRIFQRVLAGGGPTGAFRPYLYTTIRNLASSWGAASRDVQVDMIEEFRDASLPDDPSVWALDRTLTATAFRSLPERWQTVLWYTEVEGMDPHEVAPIMGLTANGVAALSYRAREGLRKAWLQAHINDAGASGECQWAMARLGERARDGLGARERTRVDAHLVGCASCSIVAEEVEEIGSHLAMVMLPLLLGGVAGGSLLAALADSSSSVADLAIPQLPEAVEAVAASSVLAAPVLGGLTLGATTGTGALVGGVAIVAALSGGLVLSGVAPGGGAEDDAGSASEDSGESTSATRSDDILPPEDVVETAAPIDPSDLGAVTDPGSGPVGDLVDGVVDTVTGSTPPPGHTAPGGVVGADIDLSLSGSGTPGAHLSLQAAGQVYATTTIGGDGAFQLNVTGIPEGVSGLALVQTVDEGYLLGLLDAKGLLGSLLKPVDKLVQGLIEPLTLNSLPGGVSVNLLTK